MNCPTCGSEDGLRKWEHVWIVRDEVTLCSDGEVDSHGAETDDVTQTFFACEDCGNRWDDAAQLVEHYNKETSR